MYPFLGQVLSQFLKFDASVVTMLKPLRELQYYDITLQSNDGKTVPAHRVILAMQSSYFDAMFKDKYDDKVFIIDRTFADLRLILDLIYCGSITVDADQVEKVLEMLELFKIKNWKGNNRYIFTFR